MQEDVKFEDDATEIKGFTRKELRTDGSLKAVQEKYDSWKAGEITDNDWCMYLIRLLENYVKGKIASWHRTVSGEYEDLMQDARYAVIANYKDYDPYFKSGNTNGTKPISFFQGRIRSETKNSLKNGGMTSHYVAKASKLDKVAREAGYEGLLDPDLTPEILCILADEPLETVARTLEQKRITVSSLTATTENFEAASSFDGPEKSLLTAEESSVAEKLLNGLTPFERYLVEEIDLSEKPVSYRSLLQRMEKSPKLYEAFKKESSREPDQMLLEQMHNGALNKMRYSPESKAYFGAKISKVRPIEYYDDDEFEEEDLAAAAAGGDLD